MSVKVSGLLKRNLDSVKWRVLLPFRARTGISAWGHLMLIHTVWCSWVVWSHCSLNGRRRTVSHSTRQHYPSCPPAWAARYVTTTLFKFFTKRGPLLVLFVVWECDTSLLVCLEAWCFKYGELSCMLDLTPCWQYLSVCWCCHWFSLFW